MSLEENKESGRNKRSIKNIMVDSRFQMTYILYFISFGLVSATMVVAIISFFQRKFFELIVNSSDKDIPPSLFLGFSTIMQQMAISLAIFVIFYSIFGVILAMFLSHKIVGPTTAIRRFINDLKAGKYGGQLNLRKGDELRELERDLNELSTLLKEKMTP